VSPFSISFQAPSISVAAYYVQGFGPDAYYQRTADWSIPGIDPSMIQMSPQSWADPRHSPNASRGTPSSQSDSENSFSPTAALLPQPSPTTFEEKRSRILAECAASPATVREAVLAVVNSSDWEEQADIHGDLLMPLIGAVRFPDGGRPGSRGGIDKYQCRFGSCGKVIKRRDHMLNHVRCHLGLKPWVCGFISADTGKQWSGYFTTFHALSLLT
jgi:hypothetical protein